MSDLRRIVAISILVTVAQLILFLPSATNAFQTHVVPTWNPRSVSNLKMAGVNADDEIAKQLARAKALLEKSKAKMEAKQTQLLLLRDDDNSNKKPTKSKNGSKAAIPFFATQVGGPPISKINNGNNNNNEKREKVVKATNDDGLVTIDGDLMAKLSETEEWEIRSIQDVFEFETKNFKDPVAERDVAASIFGLQRVLKTEDFQRIFDKRNRFIGEQ